MKSFDGFEISDIVVITAGVWVYRINNLFTYEVRISKSQKKDLRK